MRHGGEVGLEELIAGWSGRRLVIEHDAASGAWIVLAIHHVWRGEFGGGTRIRGYRTLTEAAVDAMRLAEGMSYKLAVHHMPCGGAKGVVMLPPAPLSAAARESLLRRYGHLVRDWRGAFVTAGDLGTTVADLDVVAQVAGGPWVHGSSRHPVGGDSALHTAVGLEAAMRATARALDGDAELAGVRVAVQGVGNVGRKLVEALVRSGAGVVAADVDDARAGELAAAGVEVVPTEDILFVRCDILAPCATGGILDATSIPRLRCRAVVGAANNQLATAEDAERLRRHGVLYAPDFVVNAGGAMADIGAVDLGWDEAHLRRRLDGIGATLAEIYRDAADRAVTPYEAAHGRARAFLAAST